MIKDAKVLLVIIILLVSTLVLSGCTGTDVEDNKFDVVFESEVVELVEYDIEFNYDNNNNINQVLVNGRISNKLGRIVDVDIVGKFYDKDDNYLGDGVFSILGLRSEGTPGYSTTFTVTYKEENSYLVNHVDLFVTEQNN